jgi:hypothetical protein
MMPRAACDGAQAEHVRIAGKYFRLNSLFPSMFENRDIEKLIKT